jgi:uncharacterized membrane protein YphA (DoxX/SURF4 family)
MKRCDVGFLGASLIVLLRIAIGWHFLYEGLEKLESTASDQKAFSAEIYLRNATGPLAPFFRGMVPDVNGLEMLDTNRLASGWEKETERIANHFGFDEGQRTKARAILAESKEWAERWFMIPENEQNRQKYYHDLGKVQAIEQNPQALSYERERAWAARKDLDTERKSLTAPLIERANLLAEQVSKVATPEQVQSAGPVQKAFGGLDLPNMLTTYGLIAMGGCLILGLLTPWAALSGAIFLAMIYLSMPPWPGLPDNPKVEGHYLIVSKNLIELIALLMLAAVPSGHWLGIDAALFGASRRRRLARAAERQRASESAQV